MRTLILLSTLFFAVGLSAEERIQLRLLPGTVSDKEAMIFWDKPQDYKQIATYSIFLNGKKVGSSAKNNFKMVSLSANKSYSVRVEATTTKGKVVSDDIHFRTTPKVVTVDATKFGIKGDGKTINTRFLQEAIDGCPEYGEVFIPAGVYITGALFVNKSNISIRLAKGAILKASHNPDHFPMVKTRYEGRAKEAYSSVLNVGKIGEERYQNIKLCGEGVIDNQGSVLADVQTQLKGRMARSHGLPVINCDNVFIEGLTIQNPCTWNVHLLYCNGVTTNNVTLLSDGMGLSNADGWNPDSSSDCYLINSILETHDDHISPKSGSDKEGREVNIPCRNIYISHCHLKHGGGLTIGCEVSGGVEHVYFEDITMENCDRGIHVKSQTTRGGYIKNIVFRDITIERAGSWGISINSWFWVKNHIFNSKGPEEVTVFDSITIENLHIKYADGNPIQIIGMKERPITNVFLKNIVIEESKYKVLLRNCKNVFFEDVSIGERHWVRDYAENIVVDAKTSKEKPFNFTIKMVDPDATYATKALYSNLIRISNEGRYLFGAQDATISGWGWRDDSGRCDIEEITGKLPAFYSWDFMDFTRYNSDNSASERRDRKQTALAFYEGGVNSYCWHYWNPVTQGSFYDTLVPVVSKILPGGSHHDEFKRLLHVIADYNKTLVGKDGEWIPIIFRPWHEFDGSWFWWGARHCTPEEFKALYRFTVTYLRDELGVRNFIYAFSPDCKALTIEQYLERYPGDEYVDIIAMDNYNDFRFGKENPPRAHLKFKMISDYAAQTGKVAAITETGQRNVENHNWFTESLQSSIEGVNLAYVAMWRNGPTNYYIPNKEQGGYEDFMKFISNKRVILGTRKEMQGMYDFWD